MGKATENLGDTVQDKAKDFANQASRTMQNMKESDLGQKVGDKVDDMKNASFRDVKDKAMDMGKDMANKAE